MKVPESKFIKIFPWKYLSEGLVCPFPQRTERLIPDLHPELPSDMLKISSWRGSYSIPFEPDGEWHSLADNEMLESLWLSLTLPSWSQDGCHSSKIPFHKSIPSRKEEVDGKWDFPPNMILSLYQKGKYFLESTRERPHVFHCPYISLGHRPIL